MLICVLRSSKLGDVGGLGEGDQDRDLHEINIIFTHTISLPNHSTRDGVKTSY